MTTGIASYWDRYLKVDGRRVIKDTRYERLYEIGQSLASDFKPGSPYLSEHGTVLESKYLRLETMRLKVKAAAVIGAGLDMGRATA